NEKVAEYQPTEGLSSPADLDRHDSLLPVLDALIAMHAAVPAEQARKLYPEFPAQSLILLVRSPQPDDSALLGIMRIAKANWNWLAAGNVLIKDRTLGFAALLLSKFTQHLTVSAGHTGMGGFSGAG